LRLRHIFAIFGLAPAILAAQGTIDLQFPDKGDREIWITDKITLPASTMKTQEAQVSLPRQGSATDLLVIWDRKSGNVASRKLADIKTAWKLTGADFKKVGKVSIHVEHDGKPVAVAFVTLKTPAGEFTSQIDAKKNGTADFFGLTPGQVDVVVRYNVDGKDAEPAHQSYALNLKRPSPDPTFTVNLNEPVETVGSGDTPQPEEVAAPSQGEPQKEAGNRGSLLGNIIVYLLGLAVAAAVIYFGLKYMKDNQDKVKAQLQKVGVQVPEPSDASAQADPAPPTPIVPPAPEKIILDDADPNVPMPVASVHPTVAVSEPSLILDGGDVFPLPDGETSIGREASNGLALVTQTTVSRRHAVINRNGEAVSIRDEGSSNGTYVNGARISSETPLKPGDEIQLGEAKLRFEG
jgi:hypothetical protein